MKLRPHHLLCTQGYSGKGYSDDFVRNMTDATRRLRSGAQEWIELVFSTDDLCACCPKRLGPGRCAEDEKVLGFDRKLVETFGLKEGRYRYLELIRDLDARMTPALLEEICFGCNWYPVSACRRNILGESGELARTATARHP